MPTYSFRCAHCDNHFELARPIDKRDDDATCPQCNEPAQRTPTAPGVTFNGTGWHSSDYPKPKTT